MSLKFLTTACLLLAVTNAYGAEPLACKTSLAEPLASDSLLATGTLDDPTVIQLETGHLDAQLTNVPSAIMTGGVLLRRGNKAVRAESARFDPDEMALHLEGGVRYEDPGTQILSDSAEFSYKSGRIRFEGAEFSVGSSNSRGAADAIEINQDGRLILTGVDYTTCPKGSEDWLLQAASIELDTNKGVATARGIKLRFKGIPILYAPYLSFPIGDARKSGVLTPEIGSAGRSGSEIRVPYYWNIAPNFDATLTPRLLSNRGLQLETKFRYLTGRNEGIVTADYLRNDDILDIPRHQLLLEHRTLFDNGWRNQIDFREVSDSQYYEDLGGSLSISSITHLERSIRFDYYSDSFSLFGQVQDYQTIDDAILPEDEPYRRVPQLLVAGHWPLPLGLRFGIAGEIVNFDRDIGVSGWRVNAAPRLELPIARPSWFITPAIEYDFTRYDLNDVLPGAQTNPTREIPITSLDTGMFLERAMHNPDRIQTLEPRLLYVSIPFRDQDALPVFDTIEPDINLVQLFRKNRFLGVDRIGDTEQLSIGITSRILDVSSGKELMSATIGQTRYFDDRLVTLDGESMAITEASDYIAQLRFLLLRNVNFDFGHQWGTGIGDATKSEARLQYRPAHNKVLNLAYRFRRDSLEQGDVSWSWPVSTRWNVVGRYNYSFRDREALEEFVGLEYESCCWGFRLVARRYISTRDGTRDSSFGLQLVLKGMTSVGTAADKLLERGILGYSANLR